MAGGPHAEQFRFKGSGMLPGLGNLKDPSGELSAVIETSNTVATCPQLLSP